MVVRRLISAHTVSGMKEAGVPLAPTIRRWPPQRASAEQAPRVHSSGSMRRGEGKVSGLTFLFVIALLSSDRHGVADHCNRPPFPSGNWSSPLALGFSVPAFPFPYRLGRPTLGAPPEACT